METDFETQLVQMYFHYNLHRYHALTLDPRAASAGPRLGSSVLWPHALYSAASRAWSLQSLQRAHATSWVDMGLPELSLNACQSVLLIRQRAPRQHLAGEAAAAICMSSCLCTHASLEPTEDHLTFVLLCTVQSVVCVCATNFPCV